MWMSDKIYVKCSLALQLIVNLAKIPKCYGICRSDFLTIFNHIQKSPYTLAC